MTIKTYKPYTPSSRSKSTIDFSTITRKKPEKSLLFSNHRSQGRNNSGKITIRHKGGGHKRLYRVIDFKRNKLDTLGKVSAIEYDPNRSANIALIVYEDGEKRYIIHPENLTVGSIVCSGNKIDLKVGNSLPLEYITPGTLIHNVELYPNKGGQLARAAGTFAKVLAQEGKYTILRLTSKEVRLISNRCKATIGKVSNFDVCNVVIGKAGRNRWLGKRPTVRGSAMNPVDHPHGGGEGKSPIGRPRPLTPWGKPALGFKTRKKNKKSSAFIIRSRK